MSEYKEPTNRHLRHKLQSVGRRLDELEEATCKLQKAEDELLDLQDKIIQAEGSNSSLLADVEVLRKRVLKIEGKDEEVRKAEDLCRGLKENLEQEEKLTRELKVEIEHLQMRMAELEKLEEAFSKSKSDCTQLCHSLNEEKNLTRKLTSELEALKARMKEVDASELRLDRAEQALTSEMEKLKAFTQTFVTERKRLLEKQREDEKLILKLTERLEHQKNRITSSECIHADSRNLRIEDDFSTSLTSRLARKKSLDYLKLSEDVGLRNKSENEKNGMEGQEDNKVKDLTQEVEKLKNRLKQLEMVQEDLKDSELKNSELLERFELEKSRSQTLNDQVEQLKGQIPGSGSNGGSSIGMAKVIENGKAESEEINTRFRQEKPKYKSAAVAEQSPSKSKSREVSPQQRRDLKVRSKDLSNSAESSPKFARRMPSPVHKRKGTKAGASSASETGRGFEERTGAAGQTVSGDSKKPSVLSRYPPAANDQKSWRTQHKIPDGDVKKTRVERVSRVYGGSDSESNSDVPPLTSTKSQPEKGMPEAAQQQDASSISGLSKANGSYAAYKSLISSTVASDHGSEGHSSASETESTGSRRSAGEQEPVPTTLSGRPASSKYPRYSRRLDSNSDGSSTRSSYDEEQHKALMAGGISQEPANASSGVEIRRVCSPREAFQSKAVIKPAIVEIDRKEVMSSGNTEPLATNGKPRVSTKPVLANKMTSSITIYPNDPSSSRTSSRSSSTSSEPLARERHTSTSNIVIAPSEHRGSFSIPYEISIPRSEIALRPSQDGSEAPGYLETSRLETHLTSRSSCSHPGPDSASDFSNDTESGFESCSSSSTTTVTTWRSHNYNHVSQDDTLPEMKNITVRSTWRNRSAISVDDPLHCPRLDGSEDETEPTTTWRAYRATTVLDTEEATTVTNAALQSSKPSPAEVYMRRINSGTTHRETPDPVYRGKSSSSSAEAGLRRPVAHESVTAQEHQPWNRKHPSAADEASPPQSAWKRPPAGDLDSHDRSSKMDAGRPLWSGRGHTGRGGERGRPWSSRHLEN
ncbi:leucine zipper protein 1 [Denticeps clupeoides]|uniref:Leucine zipper protein 1 n=1 Tax=Denticeps clupeoides TaxID=299321 RepID=A0AAY3ZYK0_9TELE|nr:leucine zipper protein 1 [Denticeps clupeoides]XP_028838000.1 leucine zipper protein 1 [Denticeps clupeoides]